MKNLYKKDHYVRIVYRIQKIKPDTQALWGTMNVNQMICHCTDLLRIANSSKAEKFRGSFLLRTVGKFFFLKSSFNWPKNLPTSPAIDQNKGGTKPDEFESDKHLLLEQLQHFSALPYEYEFPPHPAFGKLSRKQWGRIMWLHINHHLSQFGL